MDERYDAVVLGGGPAGLAAAWYAARAGRRVTLIERADHVGGLAGSFEVAGVRVDNGSHRLHERTEPELLADLQGLLGDELQHRPRDGRIRLCERWVAFPLQAADLVTAVPPAFAARAARDLAAGPVRMRRGEDSFASRARAGLGPTVAGAFYEPYARKLFGVDPAELSPELFRRRVGARSSGGILRRVLSRNPPPGFWYPAGGFGRIPEAIADAAVAAGAALRTGVAAVAIRPDADGATVELSDGTTVRARRVLSTLPAGVTTGLYDPTHVAGARRRGGRRPHLPVGVARLPRRRAPAVHDVRRPLLPGARRPADPPVRAGQLPHVGGRPRRPHRALRRDAGLSRRPVVVAGRRRPRADGVGGARGPGPPRPRPDRRRRAPGRPRLPRVPPRARGAPAGARDVGRRTRRARDVRPPAVVRPRQHPSRAGDGPRRGVLPRAGRHVRRRPAGGRYGPASATTSSRTDRRRRRS